MPVINKGLGWDFFYPKKSWRCDFGVSKVDTWDLFKPPEIGGEMSRLEGLGVIP